VLVTTDPPHRAVTAALVGVAGLVGKEPMTELRSSTWASKAALVR
jgi:hypothetical protein